MLNLNELRYDNCAPPRNPTTTMTIGLRTENADRWLRNTTSLSPLDFFVCWLKRQRTTRQTTLVLHNIIRFRWTNRFCDRDRKPLCRVVGGSVRSPGLYRCVCQCSQTEVLQNNFLFRHPCFFQFISGPSASVPHWLRVIRYDFFIFVIATLKARLQPRGIVVTCVYA